VDTISAIECSMDTLWTTGSYLVSGNHAARFHLDINIRDMAMDLLTPVNTRWPKVQWNKHDMY
jgi:hypothetical protein